MHEPPLIRWRYLVLINLAVAFYNVAVIWLMQLDIFPTWRFIPTSEFGRVQGQHFWRLFLVVFPKAGLAIVLAFLLYRLRPPGLPSQALKLGVVIQISLWLLTALLWGRWQGQIALPGSEPVPVLGPANYALYQKMLSTHWVRVALITAYGALSFWLAVRTFIREERLPDQTT